jgi:lysophospholipase L1-like esterase
VAAVAAAAQVPAPQQAQPAIVVYDDCSYAGAQFGVAGGGFSPGQRVTLEVTPTRDPRAGAPVSSSASSVDAGGRIVALLDVPDTAATVVRSVRVRPSPDPSPGVPTVIAATTLRTAARSVSVTPPLGDGDASELERWRLVGLPEGTRLWAHYRRAGDTVARVALGAVRDRCGSTRFDLRRLPRGDTRRGVWDLWITTSRRFAPDRTGIYVQRHMRVQRRGSGARVHVSSLRSRLVPKNPRVVAAQTNFMATAAQPIGLISASFGEAKGATVAFYERVGDRIHRLGSARAPAGGNTILEGAATWSCERLTRRLMGFAVLPSGLHATGVSSVRTPSCANRFQIRAPRSVAPGRSVRLRIVDRWGIGGVTPRLCVSAPGRGEACRSLRFRRAVSVMSRRLPTGGRGVMRIDLRISGKHTRAQIRVGRGAAVDDPLPTLLATGDSMMIGLDSFLGDELADRVSLTSDIRAGAGISKSALDWVTLAASQAATHRPRDTVILLGAADGFPMTTPAGASVVCCEQPWVEEYRRRLAKIIGSYRRGGRGRVYWLTIPLPRQTERRPIVVAANVAIRAATAGVAGVTMIALDRLFTPDGYRDVMRYRGRNVRVRDVDGLHLSLEGQAIAAREVATVIRATEP